VSTLLIVHHTPSPSTHTLLEAVRAGATDPQITDVDVVVRAALEATATDVLDADGYLLGTPANLGYMSGALKHFFDQIYYPCLESTVGRPFGAWVHANNDTTGALLAIEKITTGLRWRAAQQLVSVLGDPTPADTDACWELGASMSATLSEGLG
jgi:multimeric flavodoxin WrbA